MPTILNYNKRLEALRSERATFIPLYRELSDYHLSHRGRFLTSDRNKGHKRNTKQINNTSQLASRTLASGMMAGITSPARPWFRLMTGDKLLDDDATVKSWLYQVQNTMYKVFAQSNFYNSVHQLYSELGVFGTASMGLFHDYDNVIWCKPYTVGSYMLGMNGQNINDTLYREYELSVGQVVKQFGIDNVSDSVKTQWEKGNTESWVKIVHVIEPNDDRDNASPLAGNKPFRSVYYEHNKGARDNNEKFLRESGFDEYPILSPRWDVTGEDVYATDCPGITALGDTKALQLGERRYYQALDKVASPPLQGSSTLKNKMKGNILNANDVVWYDGPDNGGLKSIYENYRPDLNAIESKNVKAEERIDKAFYVDLFLMLANSDRRQITAREIVEKHEEKLLMLGPVLERLHSELLDPVIDRTFNILQRNGVLPLPPVELQNRELSVEYVSVLAQAQRLMNTGAIDRLAEFTGSLANVWPNARFKIDANQAVDDYADALGVNPAIVRSDRDVQADIAAESQAAQKAAMMEQGNQMLEMAKKASEANLSEDNMLGATVQNARMNQ